MARIIRLSWNEAAGIRRRVVGINEKSFQKRQEYVTITTDLDRGCVLWVGDYRPRESLDVFYTDATVEHLEEIEDVVMNMWEPFVSSTREHVANADDKIVFDKFHVIEHLTEAVDKVRRTEHDARFAVLETTDSRGQAYLAEGQQEANPQGQPNYQSSNQPRIEGW